MGKYDIDILDIVLNFIWDFIFRPIAWIFSFLIKFLKDLFKHFYTTLIAFLGAILFIAFASYAFTKINSQKENGKYQDIPSITADKDYGEDFKTFDNNLFSFKYFKDLSVTYDADKTSFLLKYPQDKDNTAIVISIKDNIENITPSQWLLSQSSGFNHSNEYFKTKIDGQDAVYTDGGMWFVANTPNNEKRISVTYTLGENGNIPFSEMGLLFESLTFKR